jgi:hypothetical protein|tara:strand:+ start:698 stop:820 length:123 start_codon:yes stop_codon:yes gene_type:complete
MNLASNVVRQMAKLFTLTATLFVLSVTTMYLVTALLTTTQ